MNYARKQKEILERLEALSWAGESPASSVPLSSDFENDARLCLTFLSFLPPAIKETVTTLIEELKALDTNQYYYLPESLHITIQNVRRIADPPTFTAADITAADRAFQESIAAENLSRSDFISRACSFCPPVLPSLSSQIKPMVTLSKRSDRI